MTPRSHPRLAMASLGAVLALTAVACGSTASSPPGPAKQAAPPRQAQLTSAVRVLADEFMFMPSSIQLTAGHPVTVTFVNNGKVDHDMKSDIPISGLKYTKADNDPDEQAENAGKNVFDVDFNAGDTSVVTFTPTTAGTYSFWCDEPGHKAAGMTGEFVVH